MGYESKIYIVAKMYLKDRNNMTYCDVIAMFNMCKCQGLADVFKRKTDCYFYADDGNTKVLKDRYDKDLTEATVEDVIYKLEEIIANGENYRRIFPLLSVLRTLNKQQKNKLWDEVVVIHYGY